MKNGFQSRFWEIDSLRGIAIIMMITYHIFFDLDYFNVISINLSSIEFKLFLYPIGAIFLLLVGISLTLSYSKVKGKLNKKEIFLKFFKRGLFILLLGLFITIVTWLFLGKGFIIFGVLHCIGLSIILSFPLLRFKYFNLLFGLLIIFIGFSLYGLSFNFQYFVWLGFQPHSFYTLDYFPLLPWFGVILIGVFMGNILYINHERRFKSIDMKDLKIIRFLSFLGRNSLIIYFLHQPILLGLIHLYLIF